MPGTRTSAGPAPWSMIRTSVPQRLAGFERVLDTLQRPPFAAKLQKRLALQIEELLLADRGLVRQRSAGENPGERASYQRVVIADAASPPGEMHAEFQRRQHAIAADGNRRSRRRRVVASAGSLQRDRF